MKKALSKERYFGLGQVPIGIGAILKGFNITEEHFRDPIVLPVVDFRAMAPGCPHDCFYCFTEKQKRTLTLQEIEKTIDQLARMKTIAIDYLGEGEPTLDPNFFEIIEYTAQKGIQPVIFSEAATKLRDREFVRRINRAGASVCPKCDSLWDRNFQNWVVDDKTGTYFDQRNAAIQLLMQEGFNESKEDGTTRLGFDMVICRKNMHEVERTLRYCRKNNLWVVFSFYLPTGRSGKENFDRSLMLAQEEKRCIQEIVKKVDAEYGFQHEIHNNFLTIRCVEFMCIYGDGRVSPCVGNEAIIGNIRTLSVAKLKELIIEKFPCHDPETFTGDCCYRESLD
jgi:MoaA/NifB/PqqE/SkfB family radical SAM enzyme